MTDSRLDPKRVEDTEPDSEPVDLRIHVALDQHSSHWADTVYGSFCGWSNCHGDHEVGVAGHLRDTWEAPSRYSDHQEEAVGAA